MKETMLSDEKVKHDLPILKQKLGELREFARAIPPNGFEYDESDHFAFMCLMFLAKQKEHTSSLLCLVDGEHYRDAGLIVRSMCEGLVQLKWAGLDIEHRPLKWRAFAWVIIYLTRGS